MGLSPRQVVPVEEGRQRDRRLTRRQASLEALRIQAHFDAGADLIDLVAVADDGAGPLAGQRIGEPVGPNGPAVAVCDPLETGAAFDGGFGLAGIPSMTGLCRGCFGTTLYMSHIRVATTIH